MQANAEVVRNAMKSPQASVRQSAMRVFKVLGGETLPEANPGAAAVAAAPDLMGDLLGEADTPAAPPASQDFLGESLAAVVAAMRHVSCKEHHIHMQLPFSNANCNMDPAHGLMALQRCQLHTSLQNSM